MLLANPRWKRRFVRFLELSDYKDGTDEDNARAARMDEWVVLWEAVGGESPSGKGLD